MKVLTDIQLCYDYVSTKCLQKIAIKAHYTMVYNRG